MSSGFVLCGSRNSLLYSLYTDLPPPVSSCFAWTCSSSIYDYYEVASVLVLVHSRDIRILDLISDLKWHRKLSRIKFTRSLLSTVFTMISSGAYSLTSNLSLSSLLPESSSSLMSGDLRPWSQAECPAIWEMRWELGRITRLLTSHGSRHAGQQSVLVIHFSADKF